jgi:CubicO group peptidase (beta-lactamase class C family)
MKIVGSNGYEETEGSDLVIVTAGLARKPGMSRDDLLRKNEEIVSSCISKSTRGSRDLKVIVVTNPLDAMCEVVRRVTGTSVGTFFAKELAGPREADFHIGLAPENDARVAKVIPPAPLPLEGIDPTSIPFRTLINPPLSAEQSWEEGWRRAGIPAAGGHGNARSVAAVQSVLACGGEVGGHRFMSERGCEAVFEPQSNNIDLVLGVPLSFGMGYGLITDATPLSDNRRSVFWGGWGGSIVVVDLENRMVVSYVMNRMGEGTVGDERGINIIFAAYGALAG